MFCKSPHFGNSIWGISGITVGTKKTLGDIVSEGIGNAIVSLGYTSLKFKDLSAEDIVKTAAKKVSSKINQWVDKFENKMLTQSSPFNFTKYFSGEDFESYNLEANNEANNIVDKVAKLKDFFDISISKTFSKVVNKALYYILFDEYIESLNGYIESLKNGQTILPQASGGAGGGGGSW